MKLAPEDLQVHTKYGSIDEPVQVTVVHRPTGLVSTGTSWDRLAARDLALAPIERLIAVRRGIGA